MNRYLRSSTWAVYFLVTFSLETFALVQVDTKPFPINEVLNHTTTHLGIIKSIEDKSWDAYHFKFLVRNDDTLSNFELSAKEFSALSTEEREKVVEHLASYYNDNSIKTYTATVNADLNKLDQEPVIEQLGIDAKTI